MSVLTVIAGPNGSGKSTLTDMLARNGAEFGEYLNADDIARGLSGRPDHVSAQAQEIVRERRDLALSSGRDHAFETVMSHPSHIEYMHKAAALGFKVRLFFVATEDPAINLDRVANRVAHGGHGVPKDRIVARYDRCLANLPAAIEAAHTCEIFDNSGVTKPLRPIARIGQAGALLSSIPPMPSLIVDKLEVSDFVCTSLVQSKTGEIIGSVTAKSAHISGVIRGSISAEEIVVGSSARVFGDVTYRSLTIEQGAKVNGRFNALENLEEKILIHLDVSRQHDLRADPLDIPVWWLEILLTLRPYDPFASGPIS